MVTAPEAQPAFWGFLLVTFVPRTTSALPSKWDQIQRAMLIGIKQSGLTVFCGANTHVEWRVERQAFDNSLQVEAIVHTNTSPGRFSYIFHITESQYYSGTEDYWIRWGLEAGDALGKECEKELARNWDMPRTFDPSFDNYLPPLKVEPTGPPPKTERQLMYEADETVGCF